MYEDASGILFLFLEQPMHPGAGVSVGHVDLPIQREVHTGYPMVQSSGVKGSLREAVEIRKLLTDAEMNWLFGPKNSAESRSAIVVTDARTLLFPVKSARGVFAWITSPHALARLAADLRAGSPNGGIGGGQYPTSGGAIQQPAGDDSQTESTADDPGDPEEQSGDQPPPGGAAARRTAQSAFLAALENLSRVPLGNSNSGNEPALWPEGSFLEIANKVIFEDRVFVKPETTNGINDLTATTSILSQQAIAKQSFFADQIRNKTAVVPDGAFRDFVRFSTQIETHVKIGPNGTVADTGPWDEELIPAETLMYCLVGFQGTDQKPGKDALAKFTSAIMSKLQHLQIGGDATLGRGITAMRFVPMPDLLKATASQPPSKSNGGAS